jgi:hypothetical protein
MTVRDGESTPEGLIPDPQAHALTLADMILKASEGYEVGTVRAHREQWAIVIAALKAYAVLSERGDRLLDVARRTVDGNRHLCEATLRELCEAVSEIDNALVTQSQHKSTGNLAREPRGGDPPSASFPSDKREKCCGDWDSLAGRCADCPHDTQVYTQEELDAAKAEGKRLADGLNVDGRFDMQETPRTDAHLRHLNLPDGYKVGLPTETVDLLRQLERELAEMRAALATECGKHLRDLDLASLPSGMSMLMERDGSRADVLSARGLSLTKLEHEMLLRAATFSTAGEWPWEPFIRSEGDAMRRAIEKLHSYVGEKR